MATPSFLLLGLRVGSSLTPLSYPHLAQQKTAFKRCAESDPHHHHSYYLCQRDHRFLAGFVQQPLIPPLMFYTPHSSQHHLLKSSKAKIYSFLFSVPLETALSLEENLNAFPLREGLTRAVYILLTLSPLAFPFLTSAILAFVLFFFLSRQAHLHLRTFALAVTTAWSGPSGPFNYPQGSLLLIIDDAFPATPWKTAPHPPSLLPLCSPLYCFTFLRSIHRHRMHVLSILLLIFYRMSPPYPVACQLHKGRGFVTSSTVLSRTVPGS